jgi:hypothetical protein
MTLEKDVNYIVSGIERSGTSMIMQILNAGGIPTGFDDARPYDKNNPKGYYELEGGKIINRLMNKTFPFEQYKGEFIKITCYGLKFLPKAKYKIIYSGRNIEEILDSMEKMMGKKDEKREDTKKIFIKLNNMIKKLIQERDDIDYLFVNYNKILANPKENIKKIHQYLKMPEESLEKMINIVDKRLYRNRKTN